MFLIPDVSLAEPDTVTESDVMIWFEVGVFMVIVGSVVSIPPDPPPLSPDPPPLPPQTPRHPLLTYADQTTAIYSQQIL